MTTPQFGMTPDGFKIKTREDVTRDVHDSLKRKFGDDINLSPDSFFSRFSAVFIERHVFMWQLARDVYNSGYRATATGVSLDHVGALINVFRLAAQPTHVMALLSGDEGTVIRAGSLASTAVVNDAFEAQEEITISQDRVTQATVQLTSAAPNLDYTLVLKENVYTATTWPAVSPDSPIARLSLTGAGVENTIFGSPGMLYWTLYKNNDDEVYFELRKGDGEHDVVAQNDGGIVLGGSFPVDIPLINTENSGLSGILTLSGDVINTSSDLNLGNTVSVILPAFTLAGDDDGLIDTLSLSGVAAGTVLYWEVVKTTTTDVNLDTEEITTTESIQFNVFKNAEKKWLLAHSDAVSSTYDGSWPKILNVVADNDSQIHGSVILNHYVEDSDYKNTFTASLPAVSIVSQLMHVIPHTHAEDPFDVIDFHDGSFRIEPKDKITPFSISALSNLEVTSFLCPQQYASVHNGAIPCLAGSLTTISTPISGWDAVTNAIDGSVGRFVETDDEFRERINNSPRINAHATRGAIEERLLQEVPGVTLAIVKENNTDESFENGQPPHSIHIMVNGGDDMEVAKKIWELKPAGIPVWASPDTSPVPITDASGIKRNIYFSRPDQKFIWVKVTLNNPSTLDAANAALPKGWQEMLRANILELGKAYTLGKDVAAQSLYSAVLKIGIKSVGIEVGFTTLPTDPEPNYYSSIDIAHDAIAVFDPTHPERIRVGF